MARLFVGCRVRIVGEWLSTAYESPKGREGVITRAGEFTSLTLRSYTYEVHVFDYPTNILANACNLEPILPEGQKPVEISKLLSEFPELEKALTVSA